MFYIRTDANPTIATGHVIRCMSIAKEINRLGEEVTFITADMQAQDLIQSNGFSIICFNSSWCNLEEEMDHLISFIRENEICKLLIDSYYVTERYLKELRKYTRIIYLDDLAKLEYPVDVLINYNNYAESLGYENWATRMGTELALGCAYAPLRSEFREIKREELSNINNVLLTTGGSDNNHVALNFLQYYIKEYCDNNELQSKMKHLISNLKIHVVVGRFNSDKVFLQELQKRYPNIILHIDVTNMSELMRESDLAITAGGSTMYELCACGVPMITYSIADNQLLGVKGFEELGVAKYCGDIRSGEEMLWKEIMSAIQYYVNNSVLYNMVANRMQSLVDGYGACRLADIILTM